jgi:hypothetical protein
MGAKQRRQAVRISHLVLAAAFGFIAASAAEPALAKTAKECSAEYSANKAAIKGAGQKRADFIAACKAGTETVPAGGAAAAPAAAAPAPAATPAAPAPAPMAPAAAPSASEAQAQATCPGDVVVWVNTSSHVYHFKGNKNYGSTKRGNYMCEGAAKAAGDRAAANEKHP